MANSKTLLLLTTNSVVYIEICARVLPQKIVVYKNDRMPIFHQARNCCGIHRTLCHFIHGTFVVIVIIYGVMCNSRDDRALVS